MVGHGLNLGRVFGVEVRADWSLLVIVFLITFGLASGLLPAWHPEWNPVAVWITALAAALAFFASILAHELSHAMIARRNGLSVNRITLFMFGGLAHLESEPRSWRTELVMALAGPVTSLVLGGAMFGLGLALTGRVDVDPRAPLEALRDVGPVATVLLWLGPVNVMLAVFNLVPGFPLDGGRVLRAVIWGATGNLREATRWASLAGQAVAMLLIAVGIAMGLGLRVPIFGTGFASGLWLALIGWFLNNAALLGYRQVVVREALEDVPVERIMRTQLVRVSPETPVATLVNEQLISSGQRSFPVEEEGRFVGLVCTRDLLRSDRSTWDHATVRDVMIPAEKLATVSPHDAAANALSLLEGRNFSQLPVVDHGRLTGLVRREDVLRWLMLQSGYAAPV